MIRLIVPNERHTNNSISPVSISTKTSYHKLFNPIATLTVDEYGIPRVQQMFATATVLRNSAVGQASKIEFVHASAARVPKFTSVYLWVDERHVVI